MGAWIDGRAATPEELQALALGNDGHFTTMQVRAGAAQGLDLHLQRLRDGTRELQGRDLDPDRVRAELRSALSAEGILDCTLRATVFRYVAADGALALLVAIEPPRQPEATPMRVRAFRHVRAMPHLKHVHTSAQHDARRLAERDGFDDALLIDADGVVAEGTFWNIGFWDGEAVTWPQAPALRGVTERLLQARLAEAGIRQRTEVVRLPALAPFRAGFAVNARGVREVAAVDARSFAGDAPFLRQLREQLARSPWQPV